MGFLGFLGFYGVFWRILDFFSLYLININNNKNKFLTHNSYFKSAFKNARSNLGKQQGDLQWK